uniref:Uncharacterized protein n=1 Tax=Kalanchoe fedtschenkoi TaxID=63787 RepID=A0A7N0VGS0_KALFE
MDVQGGRVLKEKHEVVQPQNIPGGGGGIIGTPFPFPFPFAGAGGGAVGFSPFGSTVCSWPRLGCAPLPPLFPRGPSVPIGAGNAPLTVTATASP